LIARPGQLTPARRSRIHTFIATSDLHLSAKLRMTREACLDAAVASVTRARSFTDDVEFSAEDATRSDLDFLCRVVERVIDAGATTINLPDTVGYSTPDEIAEFFRTIMTRVPNADRAVFSAHCHDDLGLAVANTLSAIGAGRAPGGVHDQRHRRARRQRVARGNRDGHARAVGPVARSKRALSPRSSMRPARCCRTLRASACRRTRRSSAAMPSRTKPASIRTAC
jgi:2-isopropylmalate synthase